MFLSRGVIRAPQTLLGIRNATAAGNSTLGSLTLSLSISESCLALTLDEGPSTRSKQVPEFSAGKSQQPITANSPEDCAETGQRPPLRLGTELGPFYNEGKVVYETLNSTKSAAGWRNISDQRTHSSLTGIKIRRQRFQRSTQPPQFVPSIVLISHMEPADRPKRH